MLLVQILISLFASANCTQSLQPSYFRSQVLLNTSEEALATLQSAKELVEKELIEVNMNGTVDYAGFLSLIQFCLALQFSPAEVFNSAWTLKIFAILNDLSPEHGIFAYDQYPQCHTERGALGDLKIYQDCIHLYRQEIGSPNINSLLSAKEWKTLLFVYRGLDKSRELGLHYREFMSLALLKVTTQALRDVLEITTDTAVFDQTVDFLYDEKKGVSTLFNELLKYKLDLRKLLIEGLPPEEEEVNIKLINRGLLTVRNLLKNKIIPMMASHYPDLKEADILDPSQQIQSLEAPQPSAPQDK